MLQQVVEALTRGQLVSRQFILHWGQPKSRDIKYVNKLITLPGSGEIGERDVPTYPDGSPIPGAVFVLDEVNDDADGNTKLTFDAVKAVNHLLGIQPRKLPNGKVQNGEPKSALYHAGLSALVYPCTEDEVRATLQLSLERVKAFDYETAIRIIAECDSRNAARSARGMEAVSGGKAYHDAINLKRAYEDEQERKLGIKSGLSATNPEIEDDELEFLAFAKLKIMKLAEKVPEASVEQKAKLIEEWLNDKEIRGRLKKDYRIRKVGYGPDSGFVDKTETAPPDLGDNAPTPAL